MSGHSPRLNTLGSFVLSYAPTISVKNPNPNFQSQNIVKFEHFGIIRFWVMLWILVWKMYLLTFKPQNMSFVGYPKVIPYTKFEHIGIICF